MRHARSLSFLLLATLLHAAPAPAPTADLLRMARSDYETSHFDSARARLDACDHAQGPSAESLDLRGAIALEQGQLDRAEQNFATAHKLAPELFAPRLHTGDALLRAKKYEEARAVYTRLAGETNILISNERLRYSLLVVALAQHHAADAKSALENIKFPTETPAYYFAQAAMAFSQGDTADARKWIATARQIFDPKLLAWFARPLYDLGWLRDKPAPPAL